MKTNTSTTKHWFSAVVGATSLLVASATQAAFVSVPDDEPESPGALLTTGSSGLTGLLVVASKEQPFVSTTSGNSFAGLLRSMVVNTGSGYDFYYQVVNQSTAGVNAGDDVYRLAIPGYGGAGTALPGLTVDATYLNDGVATIALLPGVPVGFVTTNLPNKGANSAVYSADRDPALDTPAFYGGGAAFDFDPSQNFNLNVPGGPTTAPQNIETGENSSWLVLRTNYSDYAASGVIAVLSAGDTALVAAFAPIPEPSTILFGLAVIGVCANGRLRRARVAQQV